MLQDYFFFQTLAVLSLIKMFCCGQMTEEDKGRVDESAADGCVVIKDTKLRQ